LPYREIRAGEPFVEAKKAAEAYGRAEDERLKKAVEEIQGGR